MIPRGTPFESQNWVNPGPSDHWPRLPRPVGSASKNKISEAGTMILIPVTWWGIHPVDKSKEWQMAFSDEPKVVPGYARFMCPPHFFLPYMWETCMLRSLFMCWKLYLFTCTCIYTHACHGSRMEVWGQLMGADSLLLPRGSSGQPRQEVPLPAEPHP